MNNLLLIIILLLCLTAVFIGFMTAKIFEPRHYHVTIPRMKMVNTNVAQLGERVWSLPSAAQWGKKSGHTRDPIL